MKFLGLLIFMVILDYQASAQNCNPAACVKAVSSIEKAEALPVTMVVTTTTTLINICDPTDCPPECRKVCKIDCLEKGAAIGAQVNNQAKQKPFEPVQPLEARPSLQVRSSVVGAD